MQETPLGKPLPAKRLVLTPSRPYIFTEKTSSSLVPSPSTPTRTPLARWLTERESVLADTAAAHSLLKQANGAGEHLLAIEIAEAVLAAGKTDPAPVLQQMGRALAVLGSSEEARIALERIPAGRPDAAETAGLLGRVKKDLAATSESPGERLRHLAEARSSYISGHDAAIPLGDDDGAAYCGINAAAISVWLDEPALARDLAAKTLLFTGDRTDYYSVATKAEALLILGRDEEAFALYRQAADIASSGKRWADLASTRRQCRELSLKLHGRRDHCEACFPPGAIAVFSGEPGEAILSDPIRSAISGWFAAHTVREAFGSSRPGWDIVLLELAQLAGIDTHVVLPLPVDDFITSEPKLNDGSWTPRFREILAKAVSTTILDADTVGAEFTDRMAAARASLLADHLGFQLRALAVGEKFDWTALPVWQRSNLEILAIRPSLPAENSLPDKEAPPGAVPFHRALAASNLRTRFGIAAHLHFAEYPTLSATRLALFHKTVLGNIASRLVLSNHPPVSREGFASDYLLVFDELHAATSCCLDLLSALRETDAETPFQLPSICLNAGPLRQLINPVLNFYSDEGSVITRAAAIAKQLPPGSLSATETFVSLTSLESVRGFRFEHAGKIPLGTSSERLFRVYPA